MRGFKVPHEGIREQAKLLLQQLLSKGMWHCVRSWTQAPGQQHTFVRRGSEGRIIPSLSPPHSLNFKIIIVIKAVTEAGEKCLQFLFASVCNQCLTWGYRFQNRLGDTLLYSCPGGLGRYFFMLFHDGDVLWQTFHTSACCNTDAQQRILSREHLTVKKYRWKSYAQGTANKEREMGNYQHSHFSTIVEKHN